MRTTCGLCILPFMLLCAGCGAGKTSGEHAAHPVPQEGGGNKPSEKAHAEHQAKHGGVFFMASDQKHHLEGVLVSPKEFRIYFYDEFTHPVSAGEFAEGSSVEFAALDDKQQELGERRKATFRAAPESGYLLAEVPAEIKTPLEVIARIKFPGKDKAEIYNFTFKLVSDAK